LQTLQLPIISNNKIIYIKRKGKRYILNDNECIEVIQKMYKDKYEIIIASFENLSFREQINLMNGCVLLIGCHGAGFTNTYFMNSGSILFELFPESFYVDCFKQICDKKSIKHYYMNGISSKPPPITLKDYMKHKGPNTSQFRSSIRDVTFSVDIKLFKNNLSKIKLP